MQVVGAETPVLASVVVDESGLLALASVGGTDASGVGAVASIGVTLLSLVGGGVDASGGAPVVASTPPLFGTVIVFPPPTPASVLGALETAPESALSPTELDELQATAVAQSARRT